MLILNFLVCVCGSEIDIKGLKWAFLSAIKCYKLLQVKDTKSSCKEAEELQVCRHTTPETVFIKTDVIVSSDIGLHKDQHF